MTTKSPVEYQRDRVDSLIRERFSSSYMSDAKWVRLLEALVVLQPPIRLCTAKLVWDDEPRAMRIPESSALGTDYYENAMEGMISGAPRGFYRYKEIEWIELPVRGTDANIVASQIRNAGEFEMISSDTGLRLYAYR